MTDNIKDGGPAFPVWELNGHGQPEMTGFGISMRDYFAAKAMQGLAANPEAWDMTDEKVAEWAYNAADAMLKAREVSHDDTDDLNSLSVEELRAGIALQRKEIDRLRARVAAQAQPDAGLDVEAVLRRFLTGDGFIAECDIQHIVAALTAQPAISGYTCTVPDDCETLHWRGQILSMNELASVAQSKRRLYNASGSLSEYGVFPECDAQQPADDEVVFIDGVGAGRSSVKSCHNGVQWIRVGDRVYWPLSDSDAKRLQSACCGNGSFDGPATPLAKESSND